MTKKSRKKRGEWVSTIIMLCIVFLGILLIRNHILLAVIVEGKSMLPGFQEGDRLFAERISLLRELPEPGSVVVFRSPVGSGDDIFIKRVIATEGDRVKIAQGEVYVNEERLEESYITPFPTGIYQGEEWVLSKDTVFVLGDNREQGASLDSRAFGPVHREDLRGIVVYRFWPLSRIGSL